MELPYKYICMCREVKKQGDGQLHLKFVLKILLQPTSKSRIVSEYRSQRLAVHLRVKYSIVKASYNLTFSQMKSLRPDKE